MRATGPRRTAGEVSRLAAGDAFETAGEDARKDAGVRLECEYLVVLAEKAG